MVQRLLEDLARLGEDGVSRVVLTLNQPEAPLQAPPGGWSFVLEIRHNPAPLGFSANHNAALAGASEPFVCIVNPDVMLSRDNPFPALIEAARRPGVGLAYPTQVDGTGAVQDSEREPLEALAQNARRCGIDDLQPLDARQLAALEPALRGVAALRSPSTGILDSHAYLQSLLAAAERQGAQLVLDTRVERLWHDGSDWIVEGRSAGQPFRLRSTMLVNAAGLGAQRLATATEGLASRCIAPLHPCQGRYFSYSGRSPFSQLVYPLPERNSAGLGIHATLDLGGQLRFGPDVHYLDSADPDNPDYRIDPALAERFATAIRRYFPGLEPERLTPAYSGIRPKLSAAGEPAADFIIQTPAQHGLPGLVNLFGIESPGLTASLAIAERVARAF